MLLLTLLLPLLLIWNNEQCFGKQIEAQRQQLPVLWVANSHCPPQVPSNSFIRCAKDFFDSYCLRRSPPMLLKMAAGRGLGTGLIESTVQQMREGGTLGWGEEHRRVSADCSEGAWISMQCKKVETEGRAFQSGAKAPPVGKGKHPGINCWALGPSRLSAHLWRALLSLFLTWMPHPLPSRYLSIHLCAALQRETGWDVCSQLCEGWEHGVGAPPSAFIYLKT